MNLLFLNSIDTDVFGGIESWIGFVSKGLLKRGHKISIAGRPGSEFIRRTAVTAPGVETLELSISGDFNPFTISKVKQYVAAHEIDIVVVNFNKDVRIGGLAAKWNSLTRVVWRVGVNLTKDSLVHRFLTPRLVDGVITPSHSLKKQITQLGYITDGMVRVIHTGIDEGALEIPKEEARQRLRAKYDLPTDGMVAVTSGRFVDQKGHRDLIEAAPMIIRRFPSIRFLWLGDGPLEESLRGQIDKAGLTEHFVFAGLLDDFELELAGADIMLHPAVIEPFGIVLLEGMRAGLPIIACRVGGIAEVVAEGDTALLVEPAKPEDFAIATIAVLGDRSLCGSFGDSGRERWQLEFRYDVMLDRVEEYLTEIAGERAVRE